MRRTKHLLAVLVGVALAATPGWAQDKPRKVKPAEGGGKVIEVDLAKLPPDLAAQLLEATTKKDAGGKKKGTKDTTPKEAKDEISLADAVAMAEKLSHGKAVRAERLEAPKIGFTIDLTTEKGKARVVLDPAGNVLEAPEKAPPAEAKKAKKKKKG